jgi:hypothetical protein
LSSFKITIRRNIMQNSEERSVANTSAPPTRKEQIAAKITAIKARVGQAWADKPSIRDVPGWALDHTIKFLKWGWATVIGFWEISVGVITATLALLISTDVITFKGLTNGIWNIIHSGMTHFNSAITWLCNQVHSVFDIVANPHVIATMVGFLIGVIFVKILKHGPSIVKSTASTCLPCISKPSDDSPENAGTLNPSSVVVMAQPVSQDDAAPSERSNTTPSAQTPETGNGASSN